MRRKYKRVGFTAAQKSELWDRWQRGEGLKSIGRAFGKNSSSIYRVISTGRRNTLTKTQKMAYMLMNQRRRRGLYGGRESGAVGSLESSRGAEVDWASPGYPAAISPHGFFGSGPKSERLGLGDLLSGIDERHLRNLRGGLPVRRFHVNLVAEFSQLDRQPRVPDVFLQPG